MGINRENILYGPISSHFIEQGFFVFSGARKQEQGVVGTSEFGVKLEGQNETIDVLAVRWSETGLVHSAAVECKLYDTPRKGAGASLHQATDYQLFFDEVYTATQAGQLRDKESVLKALGLGHISVDLKSKKANVAFPAKFRNADRFDALQNAKQVIPRAVLPLIFKDVFGLPLRYMDASRGGLWVAKDVVSNIQYNAGGHCGYRKSYFAINIEFIEDLRQIVRKVDRARLRSRLQALGEQHMVELGIDEMRTDRRLSTLVRGPAAGTDVNRLLSEIEKETHIPTGGRRKSKPHLTISRQLYDWNEPLTREDYIARVKKARDGFTPLMEVLRDCF